MKKILWPVVSLFLIGCGPSPQMVQSMQERLDTAEQAIDQSRSEMAKLYDISHNDLQKWTPAIGVQQGWPQQDIEDTLEGQRGRKSFFGIAASQLDRSKVLIRGVKSDLERSSNRPW